MKKTLFFISLIISILFISCSNGYFTGVYEYEYINNSNVTCNFDITDYGSYTLAPGETVSLSKNHNSEYHFTNNPRAKCKEECVTPHTLYHVYFENLEYINVKFFNTSNYIIIVSEVDGYLGDNYGDVLLLKPGESVTTKVYTKTPSFYAIFADTKMPADSALSTQVIN